MKKFFALSVLALLVASCETPQTQTTSTSSGRTFCFLNATPDCDIELKQCGKTPLKIAPGETAKFQQHWYDTRAVTFVGVARVGTNIVGIYKTEREGINQDIRSDIVEKIVITANDIER